MKTSFFMEKNNSTGSIFADSAFFSRDCVLMVSGIYEKEYYISIDLIESNVKITISRKDNAILDEVVLKEFINKLIDYQICLDLQKEFGEIRKKIVDYAFYPVE